MWSVSKESLWKPALYPSPNLQLSVIIFLHPDQHKSTTDSLLLCQIILHAPTAFVPKWEGPLSTMTSRHRSRPTLTSGASVAVMCASTHMWAEGAAAACERCNISLGGVPNQARIIPHAPRLPFTTLLRSVWPNPAYLCKYCCLCVMKHKNFCKMKATWKKLEVQTIFSDIHLSYF